MSELQVKTLAQETPPSRALPADLCKQGALLLQQQCWYWGRDICREQSNALLEYGFTRCRPPEGQVGATMYSLALPSGLTLVLWGFGIWFGDRERDGFYLNRFKFEPMRAESADLRGGVHGPEEIPSIRPARSPGEIQRILHLLPEALRQIIAYERWAQETLGQEYRERCTTEFKADRKQPLEEMLTAWEGLHLACADEGIRRFGAVRMQERLTPQPLPSVSSLVDHYRKRDYLSQKRIGGNLFCKKKLPDTSAHEETFRIEAPVSYRNK